MKLEREYTRLNCNFKGEIFCLLPKVPQLHSISGMFFLFFFFSFFLFGPYIEMLIYFYVVYSKTCKRRSGGKMENEDVVLLVV